MNCKRKLSVPVVDSENYILGIIKAERMLTKKVQDDITKDIQRMVEHHANNIFLTYHIH